ncbi:MAG: TonB-dependent receptor [Burkholderiales bacterium]|nr:TonB-dependent receptor [Burkholderiales bacterium]
MSSATRQRLRSLAAVLAAVVTPPTLAENEALLSSPRVDIIGNKENLERIPGSGYVLDKETLESSRVFTTNEALRKVPGVNVRDEEGLGLRPNIGIRGLNPTRSTKVTLLEDGLPLAYAPYGDNASYYHPPIERFDSIEVLKGAGQILYGPQTIGGVINYITPAPPQEFGGLIGLSGGNNDYLSGRVRIGGAGFMLDYIYKQSDGARENVHTQVNDLNAKKVMQIGEQQAITLRANYFTEESQVTYSGATEAEYRNFGARYNPFKNDFFDSRRFGLSATHEYAFNKDVVLLTNFYGSTFSRDWWRQSSNTLDSQCGGTFTQNRLNGVAVNVDSCNSVQGRLRDYYSFGMEPRLHVNWNGFGIANELDVGVRAHFENQERLQINGTSPTARTGTVAEDNMRETSAYSAFVMNKFIFGALAIAPGLRYEYIENKRTDRRAGGNSGTDDLSQLIPSLGGTYQLLEQTTLFAGVHRGFAPPRVEDQISTGIGPVATYTNVGAEKSWNYELGVRTTPIQGLNVQATAFRNDFDRLIAVGSIAGGTTPLSQGEALFQGLELAGRIGAASGVYSNIALTWLPIAEQTTAFTQVAGGAAILGSRTGNRLPYAPKHQATASLGYMTASGFDVNVEAVYVGEQFSDFANIDNAAGSGLLTSDQQRSGQYGVIDSYTVFNAAINYRIKQYSTTVFLAVKNIADDVYIVDRTRGILPGMPRLIQAGLRYDF